MKKNALYISLAIVATFLFAFKCSNLMTPWIEAFFENIQNPQTTEAPQETLIDNPNISEKENNTEVSKAIRRQLDADAQNSVAADIPAQTAEPQKDSKQRIIDLYTQMLPDEAARIIETMELSKIVDLLEVLDVDTASAILSHMDLDTAHLVTQKMLDNLKNQENPATVNE